MIAALLFAASLITPPHGMGRVPLEAAAHSRSLQRFGITPLAHYRGIASTKWENHWYKTTFDIRVERYDRNYDPAFIAMNELSSRANPSTQYLANSWTYSCTRKKCTRVPWKPKPPIVLAFKSIALCNGARGWITKTVSPDMENTTVRVYASAGGSVYAAWTNFGNANGDIFHAEKAIESLCPPGATRPNPFDPPGQVAAPPGWTELDPSTVPPIGDEMDARAAWMKLTPGSLTPNYLLLAQASDVDENLTPEQESDFVRQSLETEYTKVRTVVNHAQAYCGEKDGWYRAFDGVGADGYTYRIASESAYRDGMSYVLVLFDRQDKPEDAAGLAALRSFCPAKR
ncbi:MAG TPA: hypothetical protein VFL13_10845 [Candidatus Baltobacteraceae bacterium]|nr:hypothetical protein [Candidatus Baltobacteraceae bacterium]